MRIALLAITALAAASAFAHGPMPAHAREYPWCAQYSERSGGGGRNCGFVTLGQCRAAISGVGGDCQPNPRYTNGRDRHNRRDDRRNYRD